MSKAVDHAFIWATIVFTVYSQLVMRWQIGYAGPLPTELHDRAHYIVKLLLNPWIISGITATFGAGISWMMAMTKFEISYAYPFVSITYVLVLAASVLLFHEMVTLNKLVGTLLVLIGLVVIARG